jgi:PBP1b-binding outer membrane lipoprotein LpoB
MNKSVIALLLGSALLAGCSKSEPAPGAKPAETKVGENPLNAPTDYLSTVAKAKKSSEATVDTASLSSAISMFQVEKGRNPKDLDELVSSGTIKALPTPPYNMKFSYDATNGVVKVVPK